MNACEILPSILPFFIYQDEICERTSEDYDPCEYIEEYEPVLYENNEQLENFDWEYEE